MDDVKRIQELLEMHCYLRLGAWDCQEEAEPHKCTACLAKHLVAHGVALNEVDVVRCEDCKHWNTRGCGKGCGWCEAWDGGRFHDNYCSYGERKEQ